VSVSIEQDSTARYWDGHAYASRNALYLSATVSRVTPTSANWFYPLPLPSPDGRYTLLVQATDWLGLQATTASVFTINTVPPPAPTITAHPTNPSTSTGATFGFTDAASPVTFQCDLDGRGWSSCTSTTSYTGLSSGAHDFRVRAVDTAGNASAAANYTWTITSPGMPFTIGGQVAGLLYPDAAAQPIAVTLSNPNSVPIVVTSLTTSLATASLPTGCTATGFQITASNVSATQTVAVPANGSVTLPAQGATAPTLQMLDTRTNQDPCENAHLMLDFAGSAHS
jgi:hypothetical protein